MNTIYICNECGSPDIETKMWVNLNTNIPISDAEEDNDCYCNNCNMNVNYIEKEVTDKERKRLFKELYASFIEQIGKMLDLAKEVYNYPGK